MGSVRSGGATFATVEDQVLGAVTEAVIRTDLTRTIVYWNAAAEVLFGWRADEAIGQRFPDLILADCNQAERRGWDERGDVLRMLLAGGTWSARIRASRKHGRQFPLSARTSAVRGPSGDLIGVVCVATDLTDLLASEVQNEHLARTLESAGMATFEIDLATGAQTVSDNYAEALGLEPDEVAEDLDRVIELIHPDDREMFFQPIPEHADPEVDRFVVDFRMIHRDGSAPWVRAMGSIVRDPSGQAVMICGTVIDVTEQRAAEQRRTEAELVYQRTIEATSDAFVGMDPDGLITEWNPAAERTFGWTAQEVLGRSLADTIIPERRRRGFMSGAQQLAESGTALVPGRTEIRALHRQGHEFLVEVTMVTVAEQGRVHFRGFVRDITQQRAHEKQLAEQARTDGLTGLANRAVLIDRLTAGITRLDRAADPLALLFIDVDRFKMVNDSLGHAAGDQLLIELATRIQGAVRPADTVSRFGGDEFVVLCEDLVDRDAASHVADRILSSLDAPVALGERHHHVSVSIGVVSVTAASTIADKVVRDADAAMYRAKQEGGDRYRVFDESLATSALTDLVLESELRIALDRRQFVVHYQPVVDLAGRAVAVEALVRWNHPTRGLILPSEFIPLAEETGMIVPLGLRVLDEACRQVADWRHRHPVLANLEVAVNLSSRQLSQHDLLAKVCAVLDTHDLDPAALCLEITESMLVTDTPAGSGVLRDFRALGIRLAVDDFGTGYSSMVYLRRFPVQVLKLDQQFVAGLGRNDADSSIVGSMIDLAHSLGLTAIAEGVETPEQAETLRSLGCDLGQGFHWARPGPAAQVEAWLTGGSEALLTRRALALS